MKDFSHFDVIFNSNVIVFMLARCKLSQQIKPNFIKSLLLGFILKLLPWAGGEGWIEGRKKLEKKKKKFFFHSVRKKSYVCKF